MRAQPILVKGVTRGVPEWNALAITPAGTRTCEELPSGRSRATLGSSLIGGSP